MQNTFIHSYIYPCLRFLNKSQLQVQFWCKSSRNCFVLFLFCFSFSPLEVVWSREKSSAFCFHFQFSVRPIIQKLVWLCYLYSVFIFSIKKSEFEYKKYEYTFLWYSFFTENEYNDIFVKKLKICIEFLIEKLKVKKKVDKRICSKHKMSWK